MEALLKSSYLTELFPTPKIGATLPRDYNFYQTLEDFLESTTRHKFTEQSRALHVYYIGAMSESYQKLAEKLISFLKAFFTVPVILKGKLVVEPGKAAKECLIHLPAESSGYTIKLHYKKRGIGRVRANFPQVTKKDLVVELDAGDVIGAVSHYREPEAYTVIGITSHNIYNPFHKDDIIMGFARGNKGCVISIPECFDTRIRRTENSNKTALFEMIKTAAHETGHTMGMGHCAMYHCIMNSQYVKESPNSPVYFCPICVQKVHNAIGFDHVKRWEDLLSFYKINKMQKAALWVRKRTDLWHFNHSQFE
eukprot:TRINITY_DN73105_c0_g1_i1.p1 TRINITY_DN73105_c0_g1~~TRINITY_DN73105_c0_g1_i1.p1  ORF type:complete len:309 (+),score=15.86 TRINITY_DN73105_c0_g1_i1:147-1073(+)